MKLLICPFDNLYIHVLLVIFIFMLLALQVASIEVEVGGVVARIFPFQHSIQATSFLRYAFLTNCMHIVYLI